MTGGSTEKAPPKTLQVGLVTDLGGRGDQSFNDSALRGLEMWAAGSRFKDGAYEPLEDSCRNLSNYLIGDPSDAACDFVQAAIDHASTHADNATVLIADLRH